jgi:uncharacterized protein (TIGR00369 family)
MTGSETVLGGILGNELKHELSAERFAYAQSRLKLSNFSVLVGLELAKLYEGGAVLELTVKDDHRQIHNVVHGGVIATLADTAGALAAYTVSPVGAELATMELKINYLLPIADGKVEAEGRVLRAGRNFIVVECDVRSAQGQLAAKALMTFAASAARTPQTASE